MYCGWRARIGLIMPGNGTNPEYEFHKYAPEGVTVMTQRVLFERVDPEGLREMAVGSTAPPSFWQPPTRISYCLGAPAEA